MGINFHNETDSASPATYFTFAAIMLAGSLASFVLLVPPNKVCVLSRSLFKRPNISLSRLCARVCPFFLRTLTRSFSHTLSGLVPLPRPCLSSSLPTYFTFAAIMLAGSLALFILLAPPNKVRVCAF